jgi:hypothetical protein
MIEENILKNNIDKYGERKKIFEFEIIHEREVQEDCFGDEYFFVTEKRLNQLITYDKYPIKNKHKSIVLILTFIDFLQNFISNRNSEESQLVMMGFYHDCDLDYGESVDINDECRETIREMSDCGTDVVVEYKKLIDIFGFEHSMDYLRIMFDLNIIKLSKYKNGSYKKYGKKTIEIKYLKDTDKSHFCIAK